MSTHADALPGLVDVVREVDATAAACAADAAAASGSDRTTASDRAAAPRLRQPDRLQVRFEPTCLEERLPPDHAARTVWAVVKRLDLSAFCDAIAARGDAPGRPATDPRLLVALWLYATIDGVGHGRELDRLCRDHDAYRWLCGGVTLNYHTLCDFRVGHEQALDALLTQVLATLVHQGLVQVTRICQDGMRVRAGAGSSSFRREATLQRHLADAKAHVETLKRQAEESPTAVSARRRAAQERAAREKQERLEAALAELPKIAAAQAARKDKRSKDRAPRASSTEPAVRVMKMADGGFRPAHDIQFASDPVSRAIVGVSVNQAGSDAGKDAPMREQVERRTSGAGRAAVETRTNGAMNDPATQRSDGAGSAQVEPRTDDAGCEERAQRAGGAESAEMESSLNGAGSAPAAQRTDGAVREHLMDGGFVTLAGITAAARAGVMIYAPPPTPRKAGVSPFDPRPGDSPEVIAWRARMGTEAGREIYKLRAATAETIHADARAHRGLDRLVVRGAAKVKCVALWFALTYNLMHFGAAFLKPAGAALTGGVT